MISLSGMTPGALAGAWCAWCPCGGGGPRVSGASPGTAVLRPGPFAVLRAACRGANGQEADPSPLSNPHSGGGGRRRWTVSVLGSSNQGPVRVLGFVQPGDGAASGRWWGEPTGVVVRCVV